MRLKNKVALITGASRGIGKAIAELLDENGASLIINYNNSEEEAENLAKKIKNPSIIFKADISKPEEVRYMFRKAYEKFGRIDILVNNAGVYLRKDFLEIGEEDWNLTLNTNLKGTFFCSQLVSQYMLTQGRGVIINIASDAGLTPKAQRGIEYGISKAGVIYFTKCLAKAFSQKGIRAYAIAPGYTDTDMVNKSIPKENMNSRKDVAKLVLSLILEDSKYENGSTLVIRKGKTSL